MSKRHMRLMSAMLLMGICFSFTSGQNSNYPSNNSPNNTPQTRQGVSNGYDGRQGAGKQGTGREEIAYTDARDADIHQRADRKGDWDYRQNWRYDRKAFYSGETQGEAYLHEHPEGSGGPGMDPDTEYLQMRKYYLEDTQRTQQPGMPQPQQNYNSQGYYQNSPNR